jgi:hypothetical protein
MARACYEYLYLRNLVLVSSVTYTVVMLTVHGTNGASLEELNRHEVFLKIGHGHLLEYQGVCPDPIVPLLPSEAVIAVNQQGGWRYQDGNPQVAADYAEAVLIAFRG